MLARSFANCCIIWAVVGCKPTENFLGSNEPVEVGAAGGAAVPMDDAGAMPAPVMPAVDAGPPDAGGMPMTMPMPMTWPQPVVPLPNYFVDVLGLTAEEVDERLEAVYEQLFHGDAGEESVFVDVGGGEAYVFDVLHDDTRMDAVGYGMMISVLMNRQAEFNAIWKFAKRRLRYHEGVGKGFFHQECDLGDGPCEPDGDRYGLFGAFYATTGLIFADARWTSIGATPYATEARELLTLFESSTLDATAPVRMFDPTALLPYASPEAPSGQVTSIDVVPSFFQLWAAWMNSPFWANVATAGRDWYHASAHPRTGLVPSNALFGGELIAGDATVDESGYHSGFHLALDQAWYPSLATHTTIIDDQVAFLGDMDRAYLAAEYEIDGAVVDPVITGAFTMLTGASAALSTDPNREGFIRRVWEFPTPVGTYRYFDGLNHLLSMLFLAGKFRVWD